MSPCTHIPVRSDKEISNENHDVQRARGKCDQKLSAESWDEMVQVMTKHVMDKHPDVAKEMETMHKQDPQKWGQEMKPKWDAAPEC
jgi:hypothetical protein